MQQIPPPLLTVPGWPIAADAPIFFHSSDVDHPHERKRNALDESVRRGPRECQSRPLLQTSE